MRDFFDKYLKIMAPGWSHGLIHCPVFFGIEWWLQSCAKAILCLGLGHVILAAAASVGIIERSAEYVAGELAFTGALVSMVAVIFAGFTKLYQREITEEQYDWCVALRPYVRLPAPTRTMKKVDLAKYVWAFQQMSQEEQDRHFPYSQE